MRNRVKLEKFFQDWHFKTSIMLNVLVLLPVLTINTLAGPPTSEKEKQLREIFSWPASFTEERIVLKPAQISSLELTMGGPLNPKHRSMSIFTAMAAGRLQGYVGLLNVQEPDGSLCPAAVGVLPDGTISKIAVFSRLKDNPLAKEDFLNKFEGLKIGDSHKWVHLIKGRMPQGSVEAIRDLRDITSVIVEIKGLDKGD